MRLTKLIVLLVTLLLLPGTALANPQEQLILRQVSVGSFDVWQHIDQSWQDTDLCGNVDPYGQTNKELKPDIYTLPQTQYTSGFTVTRVEVEYSFTLTDEELAKAGRSESWSDFDKDYLRKAPDNYSATKTGEDLAQGTVTVQKTLDLTPKSINLKDPAIRADLGMAEKDFSKMAQGWRWYVPIMIEWYGVPKSEPDFSVTLDRHEIEADPGESVVLSAIYKLNQNHTQNEKAILKAFHVVNGTEYPVTLVSSNPNDQLNNHIIEFRPGEDKQFSVKVTAQDASSEIIAKVWPAEAANDADWSNNSDKAEIQVEPPCTDVSVSLTRDKSTGDVYAGDEFIMEATIKRANDGPTGSVNIKNSLDGPGITSKKSGTISLNRGESITISWFCQVSSAGTYTYKVTVEPVDVVDCSPGNNVSSATVKASADSNNVPKSSKQWVEIVH